MSNILITPGSRNALTLHLNLKLKYVCKHFPINNPLHTTYYSGRTKCTERMDAFKVEIVNCPQIKKLTNKNNMLDRIKSSLNLSAIVNNTKVPFLKMSHTWFTTFAKLLWNQISLPLQGIDYDIKICWHHYGKPHRNMGKLLYSGCQNTISWWNMYILGCPVVQNIKSNDQWVFCLLALASPSIFTIRWKKSLLEDDQS